MAICSLSPAACLHTCLTKSSNLSLSSLLFHSTIVNSVGWGFVLVSIDMWLSPREDFWFYRNWITGHALILQSQYWIFDQLLRILRISFLVLQIMLHTLGLAYPISSTTSKAWQHLAHLGRRWKIVILTLKLWKPARQTNYIIPWYSSWNASSVTYIDICAAQTTTNADRRQSITPVQFNTWLPRLILSPQLATVAFDH